MKTYFIADTHFSSDRNWRTVGDEELMANINATVGFKDRLFILGDFGTRAEEMWFRRINCQDCHLIYGNHDKAGIGKLFKTCQKVGTIRLHLKQVNVFLSHYPHLSWPGSHHLVSDRRPYGGSLHLYGHVHAAVEDRLDLWMPGRRSLDVSVDNAIRLLGDARPFSEDEVLNRLLPKPGHGF